VASAARSSANWMPESAAAGRARKTIMKIDDWKTRAVFDRYNIVDEKDLAEAAAKADQMP